MTYFIESNHLASCIQWGDHALLRQAYKGLARHIKNEMVHHDRPATLLDLHKLIQAINYCYWERKAEIVHEANPTSRVNPKGDLKAARNPKATSKGKAPENPKPGPDLTGKLGKDGKLTPQEHQCCMDKAYACSVEKLGILPKIARNRWPSQPEPELPSWSYRSPSWRRQKKIEQPPNPCTPWGLCLISSCTNYCHPQCLHHHS